MPQITDARAGTAARALPDGNLTIDRWQTVRLLGEGQWTRVYQARPAGCSDDIPSDYAIKVLKPELENDELAITLIQREAQVGLSVCNPHLVSILAERTATTPYYVLMPFLEGTTLAGLLLRKHTFCLPQILWIARQSADALQALHLQQWIHADVKPSNIFVSPLGHVTLIDLGFARNFETPRGPSNELVGTMNYAAPEVFISGQGRDGQSDVYSLGVILYEMLTKRLPFVHDDACDLALAHLRMQPPDPRTFTPTLPPRVVRLLLRMLAKEPLRRPQAAEVVNILMELEIESFDDWCAQGAGAMAQPSAITP